MGISVYGLLHLIDGEYSTVNVKTRGFRDQVAVYLNNARTLARSLHIQGIPFVLLTNRTNLIRAAANGDEIGFTVQEIHFTTQVPSGTMFYSAHFKIDAFRYLASVNEPYVALCDLDMVCVNQIPVSLQNVIQARTPLCYDISDQVIPRYGAATLIRDIGRVRGEPSIGQWYGGEFIAGPPEFFAALAHQIERVYPAYLEHISSFHHTGDELPVTAALETMRSSGTYVADAGTLGLVGRYWSSGTLHPQRAFKHYESCFLLHLPADKNFLSAFSKRPDASPKVFVSAYRLRLWRRMPRRILSQLRNWVQRQMVYPHYSGSSAN